MDTTTTQVLTDAVNGFLDALLFCSEYSDAGYGFSTQARDVATEFVQTHIERFDGIDWGMHGNAEELGHRLYFSSAGYGGGFWSGNWGDDGLILDELTECRDWFVILESDALELAN